MLFICVGNRQQKKLLFTNNLEFFLSTFIRVNKKINTIQFIN